MRDGCPACGSDLKGAPMDPKHFIHDRESDEHKRSVEVFLKYDLSGECTCLPYGDLPPERRFYSRMMGYEIRGVYDGVLFWGCPDCGHLWPRFAAESWGDLHYQALVHIEKMQHSRRTQGDAA